MKKLYTITLASAVAFTLLGCAGSTANAGTIAEAAKLDEPAYGRFSRVVSDKYYQCIF